MRAMRVSAFVATAVAWTVMAGCASRQSNTVMSTEGTILVRNGTVTEVRDIARHGSGASGIGTAADGYTGRRAEQAAGTQTATQVTVQLENGEQHVFNVAPREVFKVGESVRILSGNSGARITH